MTRSTVTRRGFLKTTAAAGSLAAVSTFGIVRPASAQRKISFITPFGYLVGFCPVLNAVSGGHFSDNGLEVEVLPGKGASMAVQQTLAGRAMFTRVSGTDIIKAVDANADLRAISTIAQSSPFFMVSQAENPVRNAKECVGKTIGIVSVGGGTENTLDMMLAKNGIEPESVRREVVGNGAGAFGLIAQGRIDAYIVSIGTVTRLRDAGEAIHAWSTDEEVPQVGQVHAVTAETLENEGETIVKFLTAMLASSRELVDSDDPAKLLRRMGEDFDILGIDDFELTRKAMLDEIPLWLSEGGENLLVNVPSRWESTVRYMHEAGLSDASRAADDYYTNQYIETVKAG